MKKVLESKLFLLTLLSVMFIGFTACSDDDNEYTVAGVYTGNLEIGSTEQSIPGVKVTVNQDSSDKVTLSINQAVPGIGTLDIQCPSTLTYNADDKEYVSNGNTTWEGYDVVVTGYYYEDNTADIDIAVTIGDNTFYVYFSGKK